MNDFQAQPAVIDGAASRVSAADKMELKSDDAVLKATIHITRANTGKVETYEITGTVPKGEIDGSHS